LTSEEVRGRSVTPLIGLVLVTLLIVVIAYFAFIATGREGDAARSPEARSKREATTPSSPVALP